MLAAFLFFDTQPLLTHRAFKTFHSLDSSLTSIMSSFSFQPSLLRSIKDDFT